MEDLRNTCFLKCIVLKWGVPIRVPILIKVSNRIYFWFFTKQMFSFNNIIRCALLGCSRPQNWTLSVKVKKIVSWITRLNEVERGGKSYRLKLYWHNWYATPNSQIYTRTSAIPSWCMYIYIVMEQFTTILHDFI